MLRILSVLVVICCSAIAGDGDMPVVDPGAQALDSELTPAPGSTTPAVSAWLDQSDAESNQRLASSEPIARAREASLQRHADEAASASPVMIALAAMLAAGVALASIWGWLSFRRARPHTCSGLAIELGSEGPRGKTTVICLTRPERIPTDRIARDRTREAAIRAAAALPDDPPTNPVVVRDTKDRITQKHETAVWRRAHQKSLKPATSRIRLLRRA